MESRPVGREVALNENLSDFARQILTNDACALCVSHVIAEHQTDVEEGVMSGGEPALCTEEGTGRLVAGIQIGFHKITPFERRSMYLYTDFFYFNEETGERLPTDGLLVCAEELATTTNESPESIIEAAWQQWLGAMQVLLGAMGDRELCVDRYTGEINFGDNMPPGHARPVRLPF